MKKSLKFNQPIVMPFFLAMLAVALLPVFTIAQQPAAANTANGTPAESKVDYIEKIYFSGGNKEGLNNSIAATLQELEGKKASPAVGIQYIFLSGVKSNTSAAKNSCEVEEMLAAGIYSIDSGEAIAQNIPLPSKKVTGNMLGVLNNVAGASAGLSSHANNAAFDTWVLTRGNVNVLGGAAGTVGSAANTLGGAAATANEISATVDAGKKIAKIFAQDKACKQVTPKNITIGEHPLPQDVATTQYASSGKSTHITVGNVNFSMVSDFANILSSLTMYKSMSQNFANGVATFAVIHNGDTSGLLGELQKKIPAKYDIVGFGDGNIQIVAKQ